MINKTCFNIKIVYFDPVSRKNHCFIMQKFITWLKVVNKLTGVEISVLPR